MESYRLFNPRNLIFVAVIGALVTGTLFISGYIKLVRISFYWHGLTVLAVIITIAVEYLLLKKYQSDIVEYYSDNSDYFPECIALATPFLGFIFYINFSIEVADFPWSPYGLFGWALLFLTTIFLYHPNKTIYNKVKIIKGTSV